MSSAGEGIAVTIIAGAVGSSTLMPVKYIRAWKWENTWLAYSLVAYAILPWLSALLTVPHLPTVYRSEGSAVLLASLFGLGWGFGVVMYGLALDIVGLSISSGIVLGSSVALGSLIPFLALAPGRIETSTGAQIFIADALMILGVLLCARAGGLRERMKSAQVTRIEGRRFFRGLVICFVAGILSPLLNVALTYGEPITRKAREMGASPFNSANGVWGLAVSMGSLPSIIFCLIKLRGNGSWSYFHDSNSRRNLQLCCLMGVFFMVSTIGYGAAAVQLGRLGPVIGWPVYMSALIIGNSFWGWYTGEWDGVAGVPVWTMIGGIGLQIAAMALLGMAK